MTLGEERRGEGKFIKFLFLLYTVGFTFMEVANACIFKHQYH